MPSHNKSRIAQPLHIAGPSAARQYNITTWLPKHKQEFGSPTVQPFHNVKQMLDANHDHHLTRIS